MTAWRDARLDKALAHAPDAEQRPAADTRAAVLRHAHAAVRATAGAEAATPRTAARGVADGASAVPWWRRWFGGGEPSARMPWNAAFASLLLAGVITLVWREQEIPGARTEDAAIPTAPSAAPPPATPAPPATSAAPKAPAATPAPRSPAAPQAELRAPAPAPAAEPALPPPAPAREREAAKPLAKRSPADATGGAAPPVRDDAASAQAERAPAEASPPAAPPAAATAPMPAPTPAPAPAPAAPMQAQPRSESTAPARADAARALPAPQAPAAPAPQALGSVVPRAAGNSVSSRMAPPSAAAAAGAAPARAPFDLWTQARVTLADRTVVVPRVPDSALANGLRAMVAAATGAGTGEWNEPAVVRIELARDGEDLGVLELGEASVRWTVLQPGAVRSLIGRPDPAQLRALRNAIDALR